MLLRLIFSLLNNYEDCGIILKPAEKCVDYIIVVDGSTVDVIGYFLLAASGK